MWRQPRLTVGRLVHRMPRSLRLISVSPGGTSFKLPCCKPRMRSHSPTALAFSACCVHAVLRGAGVDKDRKVRQVSLRARVLNRRHTELLLHAVAFTTGAWSFARDGRGVESAPGTSWCQIGWEVLCVMGDAHHGAEVSKRRCGSCSRSRRHPRARPRLANAAPVLWEAARTGRETPRSCRRSGSRRVFPHCVDLGAVGRASLAGGLQQHALERGIVGPSPQQQIEGRAGDALQSG